MWNMLFEGIKIEEHFCTNLGLYFTDGFGSDGSVVKGLRGHKSEENVIKVFDGESFLIFIDIWNVFF